MAIARTHILVCGGTGCSSSHSQALIDELNRELEEKGLLGEVQVIKTGCFGLCALGPVVVVYPEGCFYSHVTEADIPEIVEEHILKGRIVTRLLYQETVVDDKTIKNLNHTKFYEKQHRVALRNCGVINPENIDEYIAVDGYQALGKVLTEMTPQQVIDEILELTPPNNPDANGNELMKKIGSSLTKMKDQTASTFNRLLRRTSNTNADLLGMSEMEDAAPPTAFTANVDFVHVDASALASNDDVAHLFGLVSLDNTECKEEESDEEAMPPSERKNPFKEEADHLKVQLTMLTLSKQITKEELHFVQQRAAINKKAVERVLQCYLDSCISLAGVIV